ncbi:MAG: YciK family oxidoreductase [Gammaproteobacteria bacterium]|nr:YciK family oxidoreductase [Gammaproteobacteria bacterium]MYJ74408.1 YciK family oxidoreductase [Gammaproteobacteria bacterium]
MPERADASYKPRVDLLAGRVILVTGAGDGIGRAAALAYARHGADVVLLGRTESKLEAVFDTIESATRTRPVVVPADLQHAGEDAATILYHAIRREYGRLDGILHNAGLLGPRTSIAEYPVADWLEIMHVNVNAAFIVTRALMPLLEESPDASVVFTSSGVGRRGRAGWGAYAVSKFALEGLVDVLADETRTGCIRVNSLNPGATRTAMRSAAYPDEDPGALPTPEDHMGLYLYLIGPDSQGITGERFDAALWAGPN